MKNCAQTMFGTFFHKCTNSEIRNELCGISYRPWWTVGVLALMFIAISAVVFTTIRRTTKGIQDE